MRNRWMVLAVPAFLSGCASMTIPTSEMTGARYNLAIENSGAVEIVRVGSTTGWANNQPVQVSPGNYQVTIASRANGGFPGGKQESFDLRVEPCKRYYVNAQFENRISPEYKPVVDFVETIAGCRPPA